MHRPFRIDRITPLARFLSTRRSADLHFSNEYYFAGLFKRKVGHPPGRYRRMVEAGKVIRFDIVEVNRATTSTSNSASRMRKNNLRNNPVPAETVSAANLYQNPLSTPKQGLTNEKIGVILIKKRVVIVSVFPKKEAKLLKCFMPFHRRPHAGTPHRQHVLRT